MDNSTASSRRVLLVTMPMASTLHPNLAIEQLAALARRANTPCDTLYGTLFMSTIVRSSLMNAMLGPAIFGPAYFGLERENVAQRLADESIPAQFGPSSIPDSAREALVMDYLLAIDAADICLERCLTAIPLGLYDIVGFSVSFDAQKLPSAALAQLLKQREPHIHILFGGTGCDDVMGQAMMEVFPEIDVILQGEADTIFLSLIAALRDLHPLSMVNNCLYRERDHIVATAKMISIPLLDGIPLPDYTMFLMQREASPYQHDKRVLFFETSRGCWYGHKQHCRFCGIQAVTLDYRRRSAHEAVEQLVKLQDMYAPDILYATDAILDLNYLKTVLPEIARLRRFENLNLMLFYEIKSNLRREQVALLAAAGVIEVQPGIENFSTNVLRLMRKGATGIQQIELLKWARTYGIKVLYGIISGTPGETAGDYEEILALMPFLHHLPPPLMVNHLALHKFSPYEAEPSRYGICDIRPFPIQRFIYQTTDDVLVRLCYQLDYTLDYHHHPMMITTIKRFDEAVKEWRRAYAHGEHLIMRVIGEAIVLVRRSAAGKMIIRKLEGLEARVYSQSQHATTVAAIAERLNADHADIQVVVHRLAVEGLVVLMDERCLALAIPGDVNTWKDAGLDSDLQTQRAK